MWTVVSVVYWFLSAAYVILGVGVLSGVRRLRRCRRDSAAPLPFVSVLMAARNEEANVEDCLESLLHQDYPSERYEVVIVNDRSTDRTQEIVDALSARYPNLVSLRIVDDPVGLSGKQNALRTGIKRCRGEFILNTDADCVAPQSWISSMVDEFGDDVGLVIGIPLCHGRGEKASLFARIQSVDLAFLLNLAIGAAGWNQAASCIGNNFAYRKQAFDDAGGYDGMGFALTEDAALLRAIRRATRWRIAAANVPDAVIITEPVTTFRQLYRQRARWILGGRHTRALAIRLLNLVLLYHVLLIATPFCWFVPALRVAGATAMLSKLVVDYAIVAQSLTRLNRRDALGVYLPAEIFFIGYSSIIGIAALLSRKVEWKGQVYGRRR
jgi:cellulose synthase/poly-beta-1,6-N-acetylglucosamine synthase-like glycosyltransferase